MIRYDPAAPSPAYFTIGQLISVLALLLTFSQLTKPIIKFRIKAHRVNLNLIYLGVGIATSFVFIATILPFIPGKAWPFLGYPVFWEGLAGVLFVAIAIRVIFAISQTPKFKPSNAQAYQVACTHLMLKASEDDLRELADEIRIEVGNIYAQCRLFGNSPIPEATKIGFQILDLWSDKNLCKQIVTKAPITATNIFREAASDGINQVIGYALVQQLVNQSFENRDSILIREEDYSGFGFSKSFRNAIFGNWVFIESKHRPLQAWRFYEEKIQPWQAKKYGECLAIAFEAYFETNNYQQFPSPLFAGLTEVASIASFQVSKIRHIEDKGYLYEANEFQVLHELQDGLQAIIKVIENKCHLLPQYPFDPLNYKFINDMSVYGVIAYGLNEYFEKLALVLRHDESIRGCAIHLWLDIFGSGTGTLSITQNEIGKRLALYLNEKIDENLNSSDPYYPAITRLIISLNGLREPKESSEENKAERFHDGFLRKLQKNYAELAQKVPDVAFDLLPEKAIYDPKENEIRFKPNRVRNDILKLSVPNSNPS